MTLAKRISDAEGGPLYVCELPILHLPIPIEDGEETSANSSM